MMKAAPSKNTCCASPTNAGKDGRTGASVTSVDHTMATVVRKLGNGAFGDVLLARDHTANMTLCAIKCVRLEGLSEEKKKQIDREMMDEVLTGYLAGVHQNLVSIQYYIPGGTDESNAPCDLIFLDLVSGRELFELMSTHDSAYDGRGPLYVDPATGEWAKGLGEDADMADALTKYVLAKVVDEYRAIEACNVPGGGSVALPEGAIRPTRPPSVPVF